MLKVEHEREIVDFVNGKIQRVLEKGLVLTKPISKEKSKKVIDYINEIPYLRAVVIKNNAKDEIALIYTTKTEEKPQFRVLSSEGKEAYKRKDFDACILKMREMIGYENAKAWVFSLAGFSYLKKKDRKTAYEYLKVAQELSKNEKIVYNYEDLLVSLKNSDPEKYQNKKPRNIGNIDFQSDENLYGLDCMDEFIELLNLGVNIFDACEIYLFNEEETLLAILLIARECFKEGNIDLGNKYLVYVERSKDKTDKVKDVLEEIRKNRKFYQNRVDNSYSLLLVKPSLKK